MNIYIYTSITHIEHFTDVYPEILKEGSIEPITCNVLIIILFCKLLSTLADLSQCSLPALQKGLSQCSLPALQKGLSQCSLPALQKGLSQCSLPALQKGLSLLIFMKDTVTMASSRRLII